jgi:hypothetical protein
MQAHSMQLVVYASLAALGEVHKPSPTPARVKTCVASHFLEAGTITNSIGTQTRIVPFRIFSSKSVNFPCVNALTNVSTTHSLRILDRS